MLLLFMEAVHKVKEKLLYVILGVDLLIYWYAYIHHKREMMLLVL